MTTIKNFAVSTIDLPKILERGCRVCKSTSFTCYRLKEKAVCNKCGATYFKAGEGFLDYLGKTNASLEVVRYSNIDNPGENYEIKTEKVGYSRKKELHSVK